MYKTLFNPGRGLPPGCSDQLLNIFQMKEKKATSVEIIRKLRRHGSTLYQIRVQIEDAWEIYWLKIYYSKANKDAEKEFKFLQTTFEQFRDIPQLATVEPMGYLEEFAALIIKHCEGELLSLRTERYLYSFPHISIRDRDAIEQDFYLCGKWLALLHKNELLSDSAYNPEFVIDYIDETLSKVALRWGLSKSFCQRVHINLKEMLSQVEPQDLIRVKTHGDYAPYNTLISKEGLVIFDPSFEKSMDRLNQYSARYEDITHFYTYMYGNYRQELARQARMNLLSFFFQGYNEFSQSKIQESSPLFQAFQIKYQLVKMIDWPSRNMRMPLANKRQGKAFQQWFEALMNKELLTIGK